MQTRAVIKAALNVSAETGYVITPHIMIPLVGEVKELKYGASRRLAPSSTAMTETPEKNSVR